MTRSFTYRSPTTPAGAGWTEDIAIRLGSISGISQEAELASVGVSQISIDDPDADVGHAGDAIVGLKQFDWTDSAAPSGHRRIWTGYIGDRTYKRGTDGESPSLITGPARLIDTTLSDINSFLTFRVLGTDETSAFDRPEETDVERIQALLAVDFLSTTLFDGLVSTANPVDMDAANYEDQTPADVINDCCQQSGKNAFVYYDESGTYGTAGEFVLFYDSNDSLVFPAYGTNFAVSNVLDDIDFDADLNPVGPVWGPGIDAQLVRDPSRVFAGIKLRYANGSVYVSNLATSYAFGYRDIVMDAPNVKTEAKALARANRYLADLNSEDDRLSMTLYLPAAHVNDWMAGQYAPHRYSHLPGYDVVGGRNLRALSRTVSQDHETPLYYWVHYECTPMAPQPQAAFAGWTTSYAEPVLSKVTTPGNTLIALVITQANAGITTNPAQPIFSSVHTWTHDVTTWEWNSAQSSGPPGAVRLDVFHRAVAVGEITTTPDSTHNTSSQAISMYLYERPGSVAPTGTATVGGTLGNVSTGPQPFTFATGLSGNVLCLLAWTIVDYSGCMRVIVTTGTEIQQAQSNNDPSLPLTPYPTFVDTPQLLIATGSTVAGTVQYPQFVGAYTTLGYCGVAVEIPDGLPIPAVPYPANQTS